MLDRVLGAPTSRWALVAREVLLLLGGALLVAATAHVAFSLPFSPVPITGQTFGVLAVGVLLGGRRSVLALIAYLLAGLAGLPVFADGGEPSDLWGPTAGYLFAFVPAAGLTGLAADRGWLDRLAACLAVLTAATLVVFAGGLTVLAAHGIPDVLTAGFWPFVPGAIVKIGLAAALAWGVSAATRGRGESPVPESE